MNVAQKGPFSPWFGKGLLSCCSDCTICCVTCWLPCLTYAENGQLLNEGQGLRYWEDFLLYFAVCVVTGCQCVLGMSRRSELRRKYNLPEAPCNDCCVHCCCHLCALCQENRELRIRAAVAMPVQDSAVGSHPASPYRPSQLHFATAPPTARKL